jgi:hypothetical protein
MDGVRKFQTEPVRGSPARESEARMAKGKKGPALFEVIRASQQKQLEEQRRREQQQQRASTASPGPLYSAAAKLTQLDWLHGRRNTPAATAPATSSVATHPVSAPVAPVMREVMPGSVDPVESIVQPPIVEVPVAQAQVASSRTFATPPAAREQDFSAASDVARAVREEIAAASRVSTTYEDVSPDPVFNNVTSLFGSQASRDSADDDDASAGRKKWLPAFKMPFAISYSTGLAAGIAILLVAGVTVVALQVNGTVDDVPGGSTLANATPNPKVLEVKPSQPANPPANALAEKPAPKPSIKPTQPEKPAGPAMAQPKPTPAPAMTVESQLAPVPLPASGKRIVGVQYVVLMSFPPAAEKEARELVAYLTERGVPVTAERGLPGYSKTWFSIITTVGFHKVNDNPRYDAFIGPVNKLMTEYAKGSKFKSFKPDVYTWRAASAG